MQPANNDDSQTTGPTREQAKRAISTAVTRIDEDSIGEDINNVGFGEIPRSQKAGEVSQRTRPSKELQRKCAETAFDASAEHLTNILTQYDQISPVTIALDVKVLDSECWTNPETHELVDTNQEGEGYTGKLRVATATVINSSVPVTVAIIPLRGRTTDQKEFYSEVVQELLYQATQYVEVGTVLASRAFNSADCITEFEERGIEYLVPARKTPEIIAEINRLDQSGVTKATADTDVTVCGEDHESASAAFVYIPTDAESERGEFTPFLSNLDAVLNDPECLLDRFNQRWQAAHHTRLFRKQLVDKVEPARKLPVREFWVAATEVNAYQLARMVLAGITEDLEVGKALSFTQFVAFVQSKRQFGSLHTQE
ncbi:hypothetical protein [Halobacterium litoreum]|uniref:Transposase DDE domain-containing protein n=1 Tax=Halobacterium litoreum TaxID=2039234 RepID=A0ABD5NEI7_9EURY|nr:hypothetical protein [Halobacterium litoreum]UHH13399.1 hypothetical protein LT972_00025 [Halobacterium litoreum]